MISRGIVLFLLLACSLVGQEFRALVQGTITDPTGAVIPRAEVTLRNLKTGAERSVITNTEGFYRALLLPLGRYRVVAELQGFKRFDRSGITLQAGETATTAGQPSARP